MTEPECLEQRKGIKARYQKLKLALQAQVNRINALYAELLRLKNKYCAENSQAYDLVCCYKFTNALPTLPNYQQRLLDLISFTDTDIFALNCINLNDMPNRLIKIMNDLLDLLNLQEELEKVIADLEKLLNGLIDECPEDVTDPNNAPGGE